MCQKCFSSGRACEGYGRFPVFIVRTAKGVIRRKPLEEAKPSTAAERSVIKGTIGSHRRSENLLKGSSAAVAALPDTRGLTIASVFLRAAESKFLEAWLPSTISREHPRSGWLVTVTLSSTRSDALEAALKALVLSRLGRSMGEQSLVQQGRTAYGLALREVQKALWDKKLMYEDDTLAAGRVCSTYELYEATSGSPASWGSHELGMVRLICLRGAARHQCGVAHEVFRGARLASMIYSLQHKEASLLLTDQDDWNATPWQQRPKDDKQRLYDHGLVMSAILQECEACSDTQLGQVEFRTKVLECLSGLRRVGEGLQMWFQRYGFSVSSPSCDSQYTWDSQSSPGADVTSEFKTFEEAEEMAHYWTLRMIQTTAILMLGQAIRAAFAPDRQTNDILDDLQLPKIDFPMLLDDCSTLGMDIIHATKFLFRPENGLLGPQTAIFPLRVTLSTFQRIGHPEVESSQELYDQLMKRWGLGFAGSINVAESLWDDEATPAASG